MVTSSDFSTIAQLFADKPFYLADDRYYTGMTKADPLKYVVEGKNNKKTLVVYRCEESRELPSDQYQPLIKLLGAVHLQVDDVYLIHGDSLPHGAFSFLLHQFLFDACLFFGFTPEQIGLTVQSDLNRFFWIENKMLFFTNSLNELVENRNKEKQNMWRSFKEFPAYMKHASR